MATADSTGSVQKPHETHRWVIPAALGLLALYFVGAWAIDRIRGISSDAAGSVAAVTFATGTTYTTALSEVTGMGMRLSSPCMEGTIDSSGFSGDASVLSQESGYASSSQLIVETTVMSPPAWLEHLWTLPGVTKINTQPVSSCPAQSGFNVLGLLSVSPPPGHPAVLQFPSGTSYGDALTMMAGLGLRLADPCYEAALARGDHPAWHPASQQEAYASGRTLVVAPTTLTPSDWLTRLGSGVTAGPVLGCMS